MALLEVDIDHEQIEAGRDFDPIPAGDYLAQIKESSEGPTKSGDGRRAKFVFEIISGPHERRLVFDDVNYINPSAKAQLIGQQRIKAICMAAGHVGPFRDTSVVEFKPMLIKVAIQVDKDGVYPPKNVVRDVKPASAGQPPERQGASSTSTTRSTPSGSSSPSGGQAASRAGQPGGAAWRKPAA